ncbi:MAG: hypothetical protein ACLFTA_00110 [Candidatus Nanohaloarchaea archaeon]
MSVLDDIKDSVSGSSNKDSQRNSGTDTGSGLDSGSGFESSTDFDSELGGGKRSGRQSREQPPAQNSGDQRRQNSRSQPQSSTGRQRGGNDLPNPQAGRPQQGSDSPQLSSNTRKKMENAGLNPKNERRENSQSVQATRDDIEDLKAQNQQMIELLKRINQSLQR